MPTSRPRLFIALGALALTAAPVAARAQFATLEARAGVVPTVGKYDDAMGTGQTIGVGASVRFTPTLSLRLDADANTGFDGEATSPDVYTYLLGLETQLAPARGLRRAPLALSATLGGGLSQLRYGAYTTLGTGGTRVEAENQIRPAVAAGLRLTANLSRNLGIFAGASATATLLGGALHRPAVPDARSSPLDAGGTLVTVPVVAGVRIRF